MEKPDFEKTREQLKKLKTVIASIVEEIDNIVMDTYPKASPSEKIIEVLSTEKRFMHSKEIAHSIYKIYGTHLYYPVLRATLHKMNKNKIIVRIKDGSRFYHGFLQWLDKNDKQRPEHRQQEAVKSKQWQNY